MCGTETDNVLSQTTRIIGPVESAIPTLNNVRLVFVGAFRQRVADLFAHEQKLPFGSNNPVSTSSTRLSQGSMLMIAPSASRMTSMMRL